MTQQERPDNRFTPEQAQAINFPGSVAISAGAGSGKTRVLAERVVRLIEQGVSPSAIAAVTFTEAAAAELRERIRRYVEHRASEDPAQWQDVLAELALMQVSTIHSLCGRIAREHPVESGAGLGFTVLDDAESKAWLAEHLNSVLAELPMDTLLAVPGRIRTEVLKTLLEDPAAARSALGVAAARAKRSAQELAQERWAEVSEPWNEALTTLGAHSGKPGDLLEQYRQAALQAGPAPVMGNALKGLREALAPYRSNVGRGWSEAAKKAVTRALSTLKELAHDDTLLGEATEATVQHDRAILALQEMFAHVEQRFGELKAAQEVATFADLETWADAALAFPEVREYYAQRWTQLLIDEAQDTNPVQWRILSALSPETVNLTVVGDEKQSIYAFRRADVTVFREAQTVVVSRGGEVIPMNTSFRTHGPLVDAMNFIFSHRMNGPDAQRPTAARFEPLRAHRKEAPQGLDEPSVELHVIHGDDAFRLHGAEPDLLASRIQALRLSGTPVYDRGAQDARPVRWSDIALLLRARTHLQDYEAALTQAGIPYVVHGGRGLYDRPEIIDAVQLLHAVADPVDDMALVAVLRGPYVMLSDQLLYETAQLRTEEDSYWTAAQRSAHPQVQAALAFLQDLREQSARLSTSQLLFEAENRSGAALIHAAQPDGARRTENLKRFHGLLRRWAQDGARDLISVSDHLRQLARLGAEEPEALSPEPDAVQIMTIHGSKGLEFPVVIVGDALRQGGGSPPPVRFDAQLGAALRLPELDQQAPEWDALGEVAKERDQSELERVTYVAYTRAADLLILSVVAGDSPQQQKRFEEFVSSLPEAGVNRQYYHPDEIPVPEPLPMIGKKRGPMEVQAGPGTVLPGSLPVTSLATFLDCPRRFAYEHLEGRLPLASLWRDREQAEASNPEGRLAGKQIGDAVHRALEHGWNRMEMQQRFSYFAPPDLQTVFTLVENFGKPVYDPVRRTYQREKVIQIPVGNVTFEGVVDAYDAESHFILDYKTDKNVRPEQYLPQLSLYAHHLGAEEAALAYLRHDRLEYFDQARLQGGMDLVRQACDRMSALQFEPTPSVETCRYCPFQGVCDAATTNRHSAAKLEHE